jgi:hypothetical protein
LSARAILAAGQRPDCKAQMTEKLQRFDAGLIAGY